MFGTKHETMEHKHHWHKKNSYDQYEPATFWACGDRRGRAKTKLIKYKRCCGCNEDRFPKGPFKTIRIWFTSTP